MMPMPGTEEGRSGYYSPGVPVVDATAKGDSAGAGAGATRVYRFRVTAEGEWALVYPHSIGLREWRRWDAVLMYTFVRETVARGGGCAHSRIH